MKRPNRLRGCGSARERAGRICAARQWPRVLAGNASLRGGTASAAEVSRYCVLCRRLLTVACAVLLIALGFLARGLVSVGKASHSSLILPSVDHYLWWNSFSEVDQTRGLLQALCMRSLAEARRKYLVARATMKTSAPPPTGFSDSAVDAAVEEVRRRMVEFEGTEQELAFAGELLRLFQRSGREGEWLDLYLRIVYQHPNCEMTDWLTPRALATAEMLGRIEEVRTALQHRAAIPPKYFTPLSRPVSTTSIESDSPGASVGQP
jgi:hypothetical protein